MTLRDMEQAATAGLGNDGEPIYCNDCPASMACGTVRPCDKRRITTLLDENDALKELLKQAKCPNNCENGFYTPRTAFESGAFIREKRPCQWCADRDRILGETG